MIWQEEERKKQRQRVQWAFYCGVMSGVIGLFLAVFALVQATGGIHGGCP